ncbi:uncharacterized protein LOC109815825 isoform X2 [Cajanus cajan]|uniref:uncharacterized protein LOC109792032 isoform X2 n=3 Tax=Cajanus cajan TaxID=3821 RepID=UPI00098DABEC|nr:uncharacterized protein LOC109792032 isoform X2 [Cajanus cajan]XP_020236221.1 uncharacterized protein LOC109815825 isoform X2 [Cajanus cajan]
MSQPISAGTETNPNSGPTPRTEMFKPTGDNIDVFWKWNSLKDKNNRKSVTCDFCLKTSTGGITRAKRHQLGIKGDVGACRKIPEDLKLEMKAAYESKKIASEVYMECVDENEEEDDIQAIARIKRPSSTSSEATSVSKKRGINVKGPLDLHFTRKAEESIKLNKGLWQTSLNDACNKEARARVIQYIARFFYRNGIAFNVARSKSFKLMVEAIGTYGPHLKPPSYHELRVPLLKKELEYTKGLLKGHEEERVKYGCSIMSDGWTDRKSRTLINFLVNSSMGTMFVKSVDASEYTKTGEKVFELLNSFVEEIGEKNVVQVVTDNGSNYVMAGKILQTVRPHLFWTPCAAHCLDLMLEDIGKIPKVKRVIQRGIKLVGYIYNHTLTLNTMRKYTNKVELVRHGVTRFATTFLTLQRLHKLKANLRRMFTSDEWLQSKGAKEPKGKKATEIVLMPTFWSDVVYALKAMGPIVRVLRLVDNEKKPAMGYIYEAMERAKEAIQNSFNHNEEKYKDIFAIVDRRWDCQLHHPLHAAGYYLNPEFYYKNSTRMDADDEVVDGLFKCIDRLCENNDIVDNVHNQLAIYKRAGGRFDIPAAVRARVKMAPAEWWKMYGGHTPHLQIVAIKIHSKKRSKLEHQKLQDLVFIKYNQALQERFECQDPIDPIALNEVDDNNEWMLGEENDEDEFEDDLVFDDDVLTWRDVAQASGAGEPLKYTRRQTQVNKTSTIASTSKKDKGKKVMEVLEDEDDDVEEEEEYNSNASGSDEFEGEEDFNLDEEED